MSIKDQIRSAGYVDNAFNMPPSIPEGCEIVPVGDMITEEMKFHHSNGGWQNTKKSGARVQKLSALYVRPLQTERAAEQWCTECGVGKEHADVAACPACWQSRTRLERVLLGWEADPYVADRRSHEKSGRERVTVGIARVRGVPQRQTAEVFIAEQWGEEFEVWKCHRMKNATKSDSSARMPSEAICATAKEKRQMGTITRLREMEVAGSLK